MDLIEDFGGCLVLALIALVVLLLIACVAVVLFGVAVPDLIG